jgi:DNA-binding CsgD family transcriptional regulator/tetratricopeptide (TPR) repeat protein
VIASRAGSTFIGRAAELARLKDALASAVAGAPATVVIAGEAGIGKTRLLREFAAWAQASGVRIGIGSCIDVGAGDLAYAPVVEALRSLSREVGAERMRTLAGSASPVLARLAPFLGDASDHDPPDSHRRAHLFGSVLDLLGRLAEEHPVLLAIEDLHWADLSTIDLLVFLVRTMTHERLLIAGTCRTNDLRPGHPLRAALAEIGRSRATTWLELNRFSPQEMRAFLTGILRSEPTVRQVHEALDLTDGNPFFAEELAATGRLNEPASESSQSRVPTPLRDVLLSRIETMSDDVLEVLRAAATAGRNVSHRLLVAACDLPERALLAALRECVVQYIIAVEPGQDTYSFRHELVRETVYEDLLPGERIRLHTAIATALAEDPTLGYGHPSSVEAELAYHWWKAGDLSKALVASVMAGNTAAAVCAFAESERQFARALDLWPRVDDAEELAGMPRPELLRRAADAARWAGNVDAAIQLTTEALAGPHRYAAGDRAALYERLGSLHWEAGQGEAALCAYEESERLLADQPPSALLSKILAGYAEARLRAGQYAEALRRGREAAEVARAVGAPAEEAAALNTIGVALYQTGSVDVGIGALREAVRIAMEHGSLEYLLRGYANLTFALEWAGQINDALHVAQQGLGHFDRMGLRHEGVRELTLASATLLLRLGRWDEAEATAKDILERGIQSRTALYFQLMLAETDIRRGRLNDAERRLLDSRSTAQRIGEPLSIGAWHARMAELAVWRHHARAAQRAIAEGLSAVGGAEDAQQVLRLCVIGLRAAADEAERHAATVSAGSPPSPSPRASAELTDLIDAAERAAQLAADHLLALPEVSALRLQCAAERLRLDGQHDAGLWSDVGSAWERLDRPYETAYARWRQAESLLVSRPADEVGATTLRQAHTLAVSLSATPLRGEIEALARRARVELERARPVPAGGVGAPTEAAPARTTEAFGLTPRERAVLRLLGEGHTNKTIADELCITEKTASVHVSNLLRKLSVGTRGKAAAVAYRLGLIDLD